ncbi:uncharacterized protein LOC110118562 [Ceratitis capitata]|uniref:uncharacterized protein LOC110118562 n=1 Tax=Ceratitis capitata TaxID=7213 RepID=UPI000A1222C1|nr:uncharacterized protein LOC110118562 [Ceratitis capitata]
MCPTKQNIEGHIRIKNLLKHSNSAENRLELLNLYDDADGSLLESHSLKCTYFLHAIKVASKLQISSWADLYNLYSLQKDRHTTSSSTLKQPSTPRKGASSTTVCLKLVTKQNLYGCGETFNQMVFYDGVSFPLHIRHQICAASYSHCSKSNKNMLAFALALSIALLGRW